MQTFTTSKDLCCFGQCFCVLSTVLFAFPSLDSLFLLLSLFHYRISLHSVCFNFMYLFNYCNCSSRTTTILVALSQSFVRLVLLVSINCISYLCFFSLAFVWLFVCCIPSGSGRMALGTKHIYKCKLIRIKWK